MSTKKEIEWFNIHEQIPPHGSIIIGYFPCLNGGVDIVRTIQGISQDEREELRKINNARALIYCSGDEASNNLVPYEFDRVMGAGGYWGQQIACWAYIEIPEEYRNLKYGFRGNIEE